jgi:hypothetical protein
MKKITAILTLIFVVSLSLGTEAAIGDVPESQKKEVEHLLEFVSTSDCEFERNGKKHPGEKASSHMNRKYNHFRDKITTTEEFIEYSGTKSTRSGEEYLIYCGTSDPIKSKDWLLEELRVYRQKDTR